MGVFGNPCKYTMVLGENEESSPWEPMHVEHGFSKGDSTITLTFPQSFQQMIPYGTDDKGIMTTVVTSITQARMGLFALLLTPSNAKSLSRSFTLRSPNLYSISITRRKRHRLPSSLLIEAANASGFLLVSLSKTPRARVAPSPGFVCPGGQAGAGDYVQELGRYREVPGGRIRQDRRDDPRPEDADPG
jgi:hypothetical protein